MLLSYRESPGEKNWYRPSVKNQNSKNDFSKKYQNGRTHFSTKNQNIRIYFSTKYQKQCGHISVSTKYHNSKNYVSYLVRPQVFSVWLADRGTPFPLPAALEAQATGPAILAIVPAGVISRTGRRPVRQGSRRDPSSHSVVFIGMSVDLPGKIKWNGRFINSTYLTKVNTPSG
jgi:hypothetical protein